MNIQFDAVPCGDFGFGRRFKPFNYMKHDRSVAMMSGLSVSTHIWTKLPTKLSIVQRYIHALRSDLTVLNCFVLLIYSACY